MPHCQPALQKWENGFLMAKELPETNLEEFKVTMRMIGAPEQQVCETSCPVGSSLDDLIRHTRRKPATNKAMTPVEGGQVSKARPDAYQQGRSSVGKSSFDANQFDCKSKELEESLSDQLSDKS
jgi:hypothetical protein